MTYVDKNINHDDLLTRGVDEYYGDDEPDEQDDDDASDSDE